MNARGLVLVPLLFSAAAAIAAETAAQPSAADIEALRAQIAKMQVELDAQKAALDKLTAARQADKVASQDAPKVSMTNGRPTVSNAEGTSTIAFRAIVQGDTAHYVQDAADPLAVDFRRGSVGGTAAAPNRENTSARDLDDEMFFRRARFGVEGVIDRDFQYKFVYEFGGNGGTEGPARINDAWVAYKGFAPFAFQVGAGAPSANLDDSTTPEDLLFIERATPADLSRSLAGADGRTHAIVKAAGARWFGSFAFTGRTVNDNETNDAQRALVGRLAGLVLTSSDYNLHIGASDTYVLRPADAGIDAGNPRSAIRFRTQPELRVDSTRLIDSGNIDADDASAMGVEIAGNWRNLLFQAENFWYEINRRTGNLPDPDFSGYYLQSSWVITGESHRYNMATGSYQNPRPYVNFGSGGGFGAWELAVRYSDTDLNFREGVEGLAVPVGGVRGGEQKIWTFGVNWYVNPNLKFVFNYLHIDVDRLNPSPTAFGPAPASPPVGVEIGQSLDAYALRTQYSF